MYITSNTMKFLNMKAKMFNIFNLNSLTQVIFKYYHWLTPKLITTTLYIKKFQSFLVFPEKLRIHIDGNQGSNLMLKI